jgi:hypothetical protein
MSSGIATQDALEQVRFHVELLEVTGNNPIGEPANKVLILYIGEHCGLEGLAVAFEQSIIETGSSKLLVVFAHNGSTVFGSIIEIAQSIIDEQVHFLDIPESVSELINSNKSDAEAMIAELRDESEEGGSPVCN